MVGRAGDVSRTGDEDSGLRAVMNGERDGLTIRLYVDAEGRDCARIEINRGSFGTPSLERVLLLDRTAWIVQGNDPRPKTAGRFGPP